MAANKRLRSRSHTVRDLVNEPKTAPRSQTAKARARDLASEIHRLEVEIVATNRLAREHRARTRDMLPALERGHTPRGFAALTHSQKRTRRHRFYLPGRAVRRHLLPCGGRGSLALQILAHAALTPLFYWLFLGRKPALRRGLFIG